MGTDLNYGQGAAPCAIIGEASGNMAEVDSSGRLLTLVSQSTAASLNATVVQATAANFNATVNLSQVGSSSVTLGQKTSANSIPVTLSSDGVTCKESITPTIYNITCVSGNTEYSQALPANSKRITIRARTKTHDFKFSYTSGQSGGVYMSLPGGDHYWEDMLNLTSKTLYFQSTTAGAVLEVVAWT